LIWGAGKKQRWGLGKSQIDKNGKQNDAKEMIEAKKRQSAAKKCG